MKPSETSKKPLVILVANTGFFISNFLEHFLERFSSLGWEVKVIAPPGPDIDERLTRFGFVPLTRLSRKGANPAKELLFLGSLIGVYRRERPNLVCHFTVKPNIYGSLACGLLSIPSVAVVSGLGYLFLNKGVSSFIGRLLYRLAFVFPRKVMFLNREDLDLFLASRLVTSRKAVCLPGTGVDAHWFRPGCVQGVERPEGKLVFLMIARLLWDKGIRQYLEAAEHVRAYRPDAEFWLLGPADTGNPSAVPLSFVEVFAKKGAIRYFPATHDVRPYIAACDVAVLPSYREGVPRALLEPMAMEKPIIASDVPGCRDVIDDGKNGILVAPKDTSALAQAFGRLLDATAEERSRMGAAGRRKVLEEFENSIVLEKFMSSLDFSRK